MAETCTSDNEYIYSVNECHLLINKVINVHRLLYIHLRTNALVL